VSRQDRAATPDLLPLVQDWTVEAFQGEEAAKELPGPRICQQAPRDDEKFELLPSASQGAHAALLHHVRQSHLHGVHR